jgi:Ca-activated chloride channel family protein
MAGEVTLQCTLAYPYVQATNVQQMEYVLIEAKPTGAVANVQMPVNFSLVLDHSGSMAGEPLRNLKEAVKLVLDRMRPQDVVSIVLFEERAKVLAPGQPATNIANLKAAVDSIQEAGGTHMSEGMNLGLAEVRRNLAANRVNRMLLFTDGQTYEDESRCELFAQQAGQAGVPIVALGLGLDWNDKLLDAIARNSGGVADKIDTPQQMIPVFTQVLQGMQATVVTNARLILRVALGILPRQVWRVVPLITLLGQQALSDRDIQVSLGDLERDQGQAVLAELLLPPRGAGRFRIAQAEVFYDVPAAGLTNERVPADVVVEFTQDPALLQQKNPKMLNLVEKVTAFKLQTMALQEAAAQNIAGATQKFRAAATILLDLGEAELAQAAQQAAQSLQGGGQVGDAATKKIKYETQKLTQKLS